MGRLVALLCRVLTPLWEVRFFDSGYVSALLSVCFAYQGNPALYVDINMAYHISDFPAQDYVIHTHSSKFFLSYYTAFLSAFPDSLLFLIIIHLQIMTQQLLTG